MSDFVGVPARLGPSDDPVPVGAVLAGLFAELDRRVAAGLVSVPLFEWPEMGDIGEPLKHIELEPLEVPVTVPAPEKVPA